MGRYFHGKIKQMLLLTLQAGVALSLTRSPKKYWKIVGSIPNEYEKLKRDELVRSLKEFQTRKYIRERKNSDGTFTFALTEKGRTLALRYNVENIKIKKQKKWDEKWRIIMFDIPERKKLARDALRKKLKELGCIEMQKSVFVHPHPCKDEIQFIVEYYEVRKYVQYIVAMSIEHDESLRLHFKLY